MPLPKRKRFQLPIASSARPDPRRLKVIHPQRKTGTGKTVRARLRKQWPSFTPEDARAIGVLCISRYRELYPGHDPAKQQEEGQQVFVYPGKFIRAMDGILFNYFSRKKSNGGKMRAKYGSHAE